VRLDAIWLVRDPSPLSTLEDICWEQKVDRLADYIFGSGPGVWRQEQTTIYTTRAEAEADAVTRLANRMGSKR
jgi:hypothetical protein